MVTEDTYVAHPLDTVHHEMDSVVCSHHVYKSVWSPVIEQLVLKRSLPANPHDKLRVAVKKYSQILGRILSEKLFKDHVVFYYMKGLCRLSYYLEKEVRKKLRSAM